MASPTNVVIAGNKPFALALFAPLTERAGSRPRIAPDPAAAAALCQGAEGLLVVEYEPRWLEAVGALRRAQPGWRILAALPAGQEAAEATLAGLSVEVAPWDGKAGTLLPAVDRVLLAGAPAAPPAGAVALAPLLPVEPGGAAAEAEPLDLFHDLGATEATPRPDVLETVDLEPTLPPVPGGWPSASISAVESERQLLAGLATQPDPGAPLAAVLAETIASLTPLERRALTGPALEIDGEPIRRAAVLRFRVASALATRPPPGAKVDRTAVATLLAELDGLLGAIKDLTAAAPDLLKDQLEEVRNALVKEAVDFSEASQQAEATAPPPGETTGSRYVSARAATAKVLSVNVGAGEQEHPEERRRRWNGLIALLVVLLAGAAFHVWRIVDAPTPVPAPTFEGAPAGTRAIVTERSQYLVTLPGRQVDPLDLDRFKRQEEKKGNAVREVGPGRWIIEPAGQSPQEEKP
jgi:hypothetical protein